MRTIRVVYLARAVNGVEPFERFLRSRRQFPAGLEHDFAVVLKGFKSDSDLEPYRKLIGESGAEALRVADYGFDLRAYFKAAQAFQNPQFCFFNSFVEILAEGWLQKLSSALAIPGVGLVGATGSCESMYTNVLIQRSRTPHPPLFQRLWTPIRLLLCKACFDPFPNYHMRTNGFLLSRDLLLKIWPRRVLTKRGAYLFENGRNSLAKRVWKKGLDVLIVGKNGTAFKKEQWNRSATFRLGNQENLMIADNQTRQYDDADKETREHLTHVAWGPTA
jgi:hypothetical protein